MMAESTLKLQVHGDFYPFSRVDDFKVKDFRAGI